MAFDHFTRLHGNVTVEISLFTPSGSQEGPDLGVSAPDQEKEGEEGQRDQYGANQRSAFISYWRYWLIMIHILHRYILTVYIEVHNESVSFSRFD